MFVHRGWISHSSKVGGNLRVFGLPDFRNPTWSWFSTWTSLLIRSHDFVKGVRGKAFWWKRGTNWHEIRFLNFISSGIMKIKFAPLRSIKCFSDDPFAKLDRAKVPGSCPKRSRILASLQHTPSAPPSYVTMYHELRQRNFIISNRYSNPSTTLGFFHLPCSFTWPLLLFVGKPFLDALAKNVPSPFSICEPKMLAFLQKKHGPTKPRPFWWSRAVCAIIPSTWWASSARHGCSPCRWPPSWVRSICLIGESGEEWRRGEVFLFSFWFWGVESSESMGVQCYYRR